MRNPANDMLQVLIHGKIEDKRVTEGKKKSWLRNIREWTGESGPALICTARGKTRICHGGRRTELRWHRGGIHSSNACSVLYNLGTGNCRFNRSTPEDCTCCYSQKPHLPLLSYVITNSDFFL